MSFNRDPSGKKPSRLSPEELAGEVARRLKLDRGGHRKSRRIDIVTVFRILMGLGVVLLGVGVVYAVSWVGRLGGFETTGTVSTETPVFGCPGETELGSLFSGETVELVGRSEDNAWLVVRDGRGPGNMVYADRLAITADHAITELSVRHCDPRPPDEVAAAQVTFDPQQTTTIGSTLVPLTTLTTLPGETTTSTEADRRPAGRPPRRSTPSPGNTTTTSPTSPTTTAPGPTTTTRRATTTTRPPSSTTTITQPPTTVTQPTTTSTAPTTTTTAPTTTTTAEPSTTTTTPETTTTAEPPTTTTTDTTLAP